MVHPAKNKRTHYVHYTPQSGSARLECSDTKVLARSPVDWRILRLPLEAAVPGKA